MAVFFKNDCKFNGCGKTFPTLSSLIEHIEAIHIDFDPKVTAEFEEQHPAGIPLSYVLKYSQCRQLQETTTADIRIRLLQHASKSMLGKHNGFGHHIDEEESASDSESSNDSWTPSRETIFTEKKNGVATFSYKDKPFACSVPGCKKRYKNVNGIKYHYKNGHKLFEKPKRNGKHIPSKRNRERNIKICTKKMQQDESLTTPLPSTSKNVHTTSVRVLSTSNDYSSLKWNDGNVLIKSEEDRFIVEQAEEREKRVLTSVHASNNNEYNAIDCTSSCVNTFTQWPTINTTTRSDLTIIRPNMQNNEVPNSFVSYFKNYSTS